MNSTKMKTISTQVFDEFMVHNLSGFARKSTVKEYFVPQDSTSVRHRIRVDRCINLLTILNFFASYYVPDSCPPIRKGVVRGGRGLGV
jgi:hypothetical protein